MCLITRSMLLRPLGSRPRGIGVCACDSIYLTPTNSDEILKIITDLKNKKSSGHDGINSMLLRELK